MRNTSNSCTSLVHHILLILKFNLTSLKAWTKMMHVLLSKVWTAFDKQETISLNQKLLEDAISIDPYCFLFQNKWRDKLDNLWEEVWKYSHNFLFLG